MTTHRVRDSLPCAVDGCALPGGTSLALPVIGLPATRLCAKHYTAVARAWSRRQVGRSKWTADAILEATVTAVESVLGPLGRGADHAA